MTRRVLCCAFASAIAVLALMLVPVASFAESPAFCTKICVDSTPVEVTALYQGRGKDIREPVMPLRAKAYNRVEHEYFRRLGNITWNMCSRAERLTEELGVGVVGFSPQFAEFKLVRQWLNKLLNRYGLGYAPDIEDFSGVTSLSYKVSEKPSKQLIKAGFTEGPVESVESISSRCVFRVL